MESEQSPTTHIDRCSEQRAKQIPAEPRLGAHLLSALRQAEDEHKPWSAIEPESSGAVTSGEWEQIDLVVDSGVTENVMGPDSLVSVPIIEGQAYKRGLQYAIGYGNRIPSLGERCFVGATEDGVVRRLTAQAFGVGRSLLSVSKMTGVV